MHVGIVNRVCDAFASRAGECFGIEDVHDRLEELAKEEPADASLAALRDACAYYFVPNGRQDPAGLSLGPYEPQWVIPDLGVYPMPLGMVADDVLDIWREHAADEGLHPLVRSRLADLLWVRKHDRQGKWFEIAVNAFVELAGIEAVHPRERRDGLERAVTVSKESNHTHLAARPLDQLAELVRHLLDEGAHQPAAVIGGVLTLVDNGYPCGDLLDDAIEQYSADPEHHSLLLEASVRSTQSEDLKRDFQLERVRAFEATAECSSGLARMVHLDKARAIANEAGLAEEEKRVSMMIEHTDTANMWQTVESTIRIDMEPLRAEAQQLVGEDGLLKALARFGQVVPIGDPEHTRQRMAEIAQQFPLQSLMTRVAIGPENTLSVLPSGHTHREETAAGEDDAHAIQWFANLFGRCVLHTIHDQYEPDSATLAECFAAMDIPSDLANRVGVSYRHWIHGDHISAVSVIVLTLEPIIRNICRSATNVTERKTVKGVPIAQVRTLRPLINDLEERIGRTRTRYLTASLVDRGALNLRNNLAHGLTSELDESHYVTLFHLACMLGWMSSAGH